MKLAGHKFTRENKCTTLGVATVYDWENLTLLADGFVPVGWCPESEIHPLLQKGGGYHPMMVFAPDLGEIWCHVTLQTLSQHFPEAPRVLRTIETIQAGIPITRKDTP